MQGQESMCDDVSVCMLCCRCRRRCRCCCRCCYCYRRLCRCRCCGLNGLVVYVIAMYVVVHVSQCVACVCVDVCMRVSMSLLLLLSGFASMFCRRQRLYSNVCAYLCVCLHRYSLRLFQCVPVSSSTSALSSSFEPAACECLHAVSVSILVIMLCEFALGCC